MPASRRPTVRDRLLGAGLQTRLLAAVAVLVVACGGFLAHRSVAALGDAYRWTGEAEAAALAHSFARSLSPRDLADVERIRSRVVRLSGVHPDLTEVAVQEPPAGTSKRAVYTVGERAAELAFPILDGTGRPVAVLRLRFSRDESATALAAGRREGAAGGARRGAAARDR